MDGEALRPLGGGRELAPTRVQGPAWCGGGVFYDLQGEAMFHKGLALEGSSQTAGYWLEWT